MLDISLRDLLEAGVHFGHQKGRWNPKMRPYIYGAKDGIHIIDLQQTARGLVNASRFATSVVAGGKPVLFVGTKRAARDVVSEEAERAGQFFVNHRWLGGTLTNWQTVKKSIEKLRKLEHARDEGRFDLLTQKEALLATRELFAGMAASATGSALPNSHGGGTTSAYLPRAFCKRLGIPLISMTGDQESTLAQAAAARLDTSVSQEACPLDLAPTSSTTVSLVMGDALAIALLEARGFSAEDFAFSHPGGALGRKLLLKVEDVMHQGETLPRVSPDVMLSDALLEMTAKGLGMTSIISHDGTLLGVFTDGDLRRTLDNPIDVHKTAITEVMTPNCKTVTADMLAAEALAIMEEHKINGLIVVDTDNHPIGALNMHDLLQAGVV